MIKVTIKQKMRLNMAQFFLLGFVFLFSSCGDQVFTITGKTMGSTYNIKYVSSSDQNEKLQKLIEARLLKINKAASTYDKESEISKLNKNKIIERRIILSADLFIPLENSFLMASKSKGVFDPTIGPLVNLWGFGPDNEKKVPTNKEIELAKERVGYKNIFLDPMDFSLIKKRSDIYIDLSATAKGYAVDRINELLYSEGLRDYMVEIGGELAAIGENLNKPWNIAVEAPHPDVLNKSIKKILKISNLSMATSGNYRNFFEEKGKRYSHTIDYKSGKPVTWIMASVTVLDKKCMNADSWATALMALGPEKGLELAELHKVPAYFIYNPTGIIGEKFVEKKTSYFDNALKLGEVD